MAGEDTSKTQLYNDIYNNIKYGSQDFNNFINSTAFNIAAASTFGIGVYALDKKAELPDGLALANATTAAVVMYEDLVLDTPASTITGAFHKLADDLSNELKNPDQFIQKIEDLASDIKNSLTSSSQEYQYLNDLSSLTQDQKTTFSNVITEDSTKIQEVGKNVTETSQTIFYTLTGQLNVSTNATFNMDVYANLLIDPTSQFDVTSGTASIGANSTVSLTGGSNVTIGNGNADITSGFLISTGDSFSAVDSKITAQNGAIISESGTLSGASGYKVTVDMKNAVWEIDNSSENINSNYSFSNSNLSLTNGSAFNIDGTTNINSSNFNIGANSSITNNNNFSANGATLTLTGDSSITNNGTLDFGSGGSTSLLNGSCISVDGTSTANLSGTTYITDDSSLQSIEGMNVTNSGQIYLYSDSSLCEHAWYPGYYLNNVEGSIIIGYSSDFCLGGDSYSGVMIEYDGIIVPWYGGSLDASPSDILTDIDTEYNEIYDSYYEEEWDC